jgi:hAT family C-terminal dimerisation region
MAVFAASESTKLHDKLNHYLNSDPVQVADAIRWWYNYYAKYPRLLRMAMNYLIIPRK